jgi:hypothetical protein
VRDCVGVLVGGQRLPRLVDDVAMRHVQRCRRWAEAGRLTARWRPCRRATCPHARRAAS